MLFLLCRNAILSPFIRIHQVAINVHLIIKTQVTTFYIPIYSCLKHKHFHCLITMITRYGREVARYQWIKRQAMTDTHFFFIKDFTLLLGYIMAHRGNIQGHGFTLEWLVFGEYHNMAGVTLKYCDTPHCRIWTALLDIPFLLWMCKLLVPVRSL